MKIEFEPGAKIVGTKRVSAKGQVSGLTEFAGKEVMIILVPKTGKTVKPTMEYFYHELHSAAEEHMKLAFKRSNKLRDVFGTPEKAVKQFFEKYTPQSVQTMKSDLDKWLRNFKQDVVKSQIEGFVNEQMKVVFKEYEKLRENFKSPDDATREFINRYAPKSTQKLFDDLNAWVDSVAPKTVRDQVKMAAEEHIKLAFEQYDGLKKKFGTADLAAEEFLKKHAPNSVSKLLEDMQAWLDKYKHRSTK